MLTVKIEGKEWWDDEAEEFKRIKPKTIQLEHSLISLSKWESKWKKPYLDEDTQKTSEENLDYIRCMIITPNVDPDIVYSLAPSQIMEITKYVNDKMTASWFRETPGSATRRTGEKVTSDLIYYWMLVHNIPFECQKWHLNRLLTLIRICNVKAEKPKPMSKSQLAASRASLNAKRRAKHHSKG